MSEPDAGLVSIVASGQDLPVCLWVGDSRIFWANQGHKEVWSRALAGGPVERWLSYGPSFSDGLAHHRGELFVLSGSRVLARAEGAAEPRVVVDLVERGLRAAEDFEGIEAIAHDEGALYATVTDPSRPARGRLLRIDHGRVELLSDRLTDPGGMACSPHGVFVVCGRSALAEVPKLGGKPKIIARGSIRAVAVDGDTPYWIEATAGTRIFRRRPGGAAEQVSEGPGVLAWTLAVERGRVVYGMEDGVRWVDVESGQVHVLARESMPVSAVAIGHGSVFWAVRGEPARGHVMCTAWPPVGTPTGQRRA